jgi:hypothetical protein
VRHEPHRFYGSKRGWHLRSQSPWRYLILIFVTEGEMQVISSTTSLHFYNICKNLNMFLDMALYLFYKRFQVSRF